MNLLSMGSRAVLLAGLLLIGAVFANAQSLEELTNKKSLDVISLNFYVKSNKNGVTKSEGVGYITLEADIKDQKIQRFSVAAYASGLGVYDFSLEAKDLIGKKVPLKASGVSLGELDGQKMNAVGEGLLRFTPNSSILGPKVPRSVEVALKRVAPSMKWLVYHQGRILEKMTMEVNKAPAGMSAMSLFFSPPKVISVQTTFASCENWLVSQMIVEMQSPEQVKFLNCNFKEMSDSDIVNLVAGLVRSADVYFAFYNQQQSAEQQVARLEWALKVLNSLGVDWMRALKNENVDYMNAGADPGDYSVSSLFSALIASGQEKMIEDLVAQGIVPNRKDTDLLETALVHGVQYNAKTQTASESKTASRIYQSMRRQIDGTLSAAGVLRKVLDFSLARPRTFYMADETAKNLGQLVLPMTEMLALEKADFLQRDPEDESPLEIIKRITVSSDEVVFSNDYLRPGDGKKLSARLRELGMK